MNNKQNSKRSLTFLLEHALDKGDKPSSLPKKRAKKSPHKLPLVKQEVFDDEAEVARHEEEEEDDHDSSQELDDQVSSRSNTEINEDDDDNDGDEEAMSNVSEGAIIEDGDEIGPPLSPSELTTHLMALNSSFLFNKNLLLSNMAQSLMMQSSVFVMILESIFPL